MLILTRKQSEEIRIGDNVRIKVIRTGRSTVKLGIEAPRDVRVLRGELCGGELQVRKGDVIEFPETSRAVSDQFPHPHIA